MLTTLCWRARLCAVLEGMVLTVELTKVDGPDGKALFDSVFGDSKKGASRTAQGHVGDG